MKSNTTTIIPNEGLKPKKVTGILSVIAKNLVCKQLQKLSEGQLVINDQGDRYYFGKPSDDFHVSAVINVTDDHFYSLVKDSARDVQIIKNPPYG